MSSIIFTSLYKSITIATILSSFFFVTFCSLYFDLYFSLLFNRQLLMQFYDCLKVAVKIIPSMLTLILELLVVFVLMLRYLLYLLSSSIYALMISSEFDSLIHLWNNSLFFFLFFPVLVYGIYLDSTCT